jgi:hypothetical protein
LIGIAQRQCRDRRQDGAQQPEDAAADQRHMKTGDRQHMGKAGIAQRRLVFFLDAAAFASDQRAGDAAAVARQCRTDFPRHGQAQIFQTGLQPFQRVGRAGGDDRMGAAIGKTHRADGLKEQAAAQIAGARFGRRRQRTQPRRQADPVAGTEITAQGHAHTPGRGVERAGMHRIQNGTHALPPGLQRDDAGGKMSHGAVIQHRRGHTHFFQPGRAKPQKQSRHQRERPARQPGDGRHRRRHAQRNPRPAPERRGLERQREIQRRTRAQKDRKPQRPAIAFRCQEGICQCAGSALSPFDHGRKLQTRPAFRPLAHRHAAYRRRAYRLVQLALCPPHRRHLSSAHRRHRP